MEEPTPVSWPDFPTLGDLPEQEFDDYISELNPPSEGTAFTNPVEMFRRRRRLLTPPLEVSRLEGDTFVSRWDVPAPTGPVDIVVARVYAAEMPQRQFEAKLVIGAEHEFQQKRKSAVSHARVVEGATGYFLPLSNIPFIQNLHLERGASLNIRIVFLDGNASKAAIAFLKGNIFQTGVKLTRKFNPVFGIAAECLSSLTASLLSAGKNRVVSQGTFGLFDHGGVLSNTFGIGDYLFAQLPTDIATRAHGKSLRWDGEKNQVLDGHKPLDANYLLLRIAASAEAD